MDRFALAFSLGKDSGLALYKMLAKGNVPVCLLTMFREDLGRSWFHGADAMLLAEMEKALGIPLKICRATDAGYAAAFEKGLEFAKKKGAEVCAFGDIDIESNRKWEQDRCAAAGIKAIFPLWQRPRQELLEELLSLDFECLIKTIRLDNLPLEREQTKDFAKTFLGKPLGKAFINELVSMGMDACGENGEYHTLAVNGPIFKRPLRYKTGSILFLDNHATVEINLNV